MLLSRRRRAVAVLAGLALAGGLTPPAHASNDPNWDKQWGMQTIGVPTAWTRTTGAGVKIGIVDTGVDLGHEDLAGQIAETTSCLDTNGNPLKCAGS
ncbi:MAG TPA: hypothetical protein VGF00_12515, partial [Acidimicrobiia bacterium]